MQDCRAWIFKLHSGSVVISLDLNGQYSGLAINIRNLVLRRSWRQTMEISDKTIMDFIIRAPLPKKEAFSKPRHLGCERLRLWSREVRSMNFQPFHG